MAGKPMHVRLGDGERFVFLGGIELTVLISGSDTDGAFSIFEDVVQPGVGPPRHIHNNQAEVFSIIDGSFELEIAGELFSAKTGDIAFVPRGAVHAFKNVGSEPARLRYTFTPAGDTEAMFRAFFKANEANELTPERMSEIAKGYDQTFVGPPL